jgi:transcriptional regulator with XRE-family HTH domain
MTGSGPLTVAAVGAVIRAYRKASGLSQKDLAKLGGVSRATLNYLESGREDMEIGASRLFALLAVLGVPLAIPTEVDRGADDASLEATIRRIGAGRRRPSVSLIMEALAAGRVPEDSATVLAAYFAAVDTGEAVLAVRSAAVRSGHPPKDIWRNARTLAKALGVDRPEWHRGG